jgi:cysteine-rich repeat protein
LAGKEMVRVPLADTCDCSATIQTVSVTAPALLELVKNGDNNFAVHTTGELAWATVHIVTPTQDSTQKVYDSNGDYDPAHQPTDLCAAGAQLGVESVTDMQLGGGGVCNTCGNGVVEPFEQCDDGNTIDGDGCSHACAIEKCFNVTCAACLSCDPTTGACAIPRADGSSCSDGNACTQGDTCVAGSCVSGPLVTCTASDGCHDIGTCDPGTGACSTPAAPNGTSCNDNNACTRTDTCQNGTCTGGNPVTCTALDQCHVAGTCDTSTGLCSNPAKADGVSCTDGNPCTEGGTCQAGACIGGRPKTCTALDACHVAGTCSPSTGACSNPAAANGTSCNDNNACTRTDTCQSGACVGSNPVTCLPGDQCHQVGACVPATGTCAYAPKPDGAVCNDSNLCTQTDACQSGVCVGSNPVVCTGGNQCQTAGACDPASGICLHPGKANGTGCDDGDASTEGDTCQMGSCLGIPSKPSPTVSTVVGSLGFLYQGTGASQIGVASGTIDAKRATGVRGQVLAGDGAPLGGAKVTIADHPEYGYSSTTEDGRFAMVVNGGGRVTVRLTKNGYLMAERSAEVPWQGYAEVESMVLLAASAEVSIVNPGQQGMQVAAGSQVTDADGSRQAVLLFPSGTGASMTINGTKVALGSLRVRITEVTVGENGQSALPGPLPATSAYTYAVAYTVDEALASGGAIVTFDRPIYHYSENFLGFPVGTKVPSAYYDTATHRWVPSKDGLVIKVLAVDAGQASVDVDGNGLPADGSAIPWSTPRPRGT